MLQDGPAGAGAREVRARLQETRARRLREAGSSEEEMAAAIRDAPQHVTSWLVGADGEKWVGRVLEQWAVRTGFALLTDVTPPGQKSNLDFIVVGRCGVVVVDAKKWKGSLRFEAGTMWIGSHDKSKEVAGVEGQVEQVTEALTSAGVFVPVRGMMAMANSNPGLPGHGLEHVRDIAIGKPDEVGRAVGRDGLLGEVDVDRAVAVLCAAFNMRGFLPQTLAAHRRALSTPAQRQIAQRRFVIPALRWCLRPRVLVTLACAAAVLVVVEGGSFGDERASSATVTAADLRSALPRLREVANDAAHGAVRGPAVRTTSTEFRLAFRRGRCRVVLRVDRQSASFVTSAGVEQGRHCRP